MSERSRLCMFVILVIGIFIVDIIHPDDIKQTSPVLMYVLGHYIGATVQKEVTDASGGITTTRAKRRKRGKRNW